MQRKTPSFATNVKGGRAAAMSGQVPHLKGCQALLVVRKGQAERAGRAQRKLHHQRGVRLNRDHQAHLATPAAARLHLLKHALCNVDAEAGMWQL
jgi:hypothetical protein